MKRITTALTHQSRSERNIATATASVRLRRDIKLSWAIQSAGDRKQARRERLEAWAHRLAVRWGCVDDVLATITAETLDR
jgi:hypothetical protein